MARGFKPKAGSKTARVSRPGPFSYRTNWALRRLDVLEGLLDLGGHGLGRVSDELGGEFLKVLHLRGDGIELLTGEGGLQLDNLCEGLGAEEVADKRKGSVGV